MTLSFFTKRAELDATGFIRVEENFGVWNHVVYHFEDMEIVEKWLNTEEYDFRDREIMSKTAAIKLAGKKTVDESVTAHS